MWERAVGSTIERELRKGSRRRYHRVNAKELSILGRENRQRRDSNARTTTWSVQAPRRPVARAE